MCRVPSGVSLLYIYTDCDCVLCFFVSVRVIDCRWHLRERLGKKKNRIFPLHRTFFSFFFWQFSFYLFIIFGNFNFLIFFLLYFSCVRYISGTDKPKRTDPENWFFWFLFFKTRFFDFVSSLCESGNSSNFIGQKESFWIISLDVWRRGANSDTHRPTHKEFTINLCARPSLVGITCICRGVPFELFSPIRTDND